MTPDRIAAGRRNLCATPSLFSKIGRRDGRKVTFYSFSGSTFLTMGTVSPWSVKGVEPEAREAAKTAARRAGMTVGQWLSRTIRAAAAHPAGNGGAVPADGRRDTGRDDVSAREAQVAAQRAQAVAELSAASMERALHRLVERIDRMPPATGSPGGDPRWSVSIRRAD